MSVTNWFELALHFATLSLMAVGGAISLVPEMHRFLVDEMHWLRDEQFNASVAIAQAAPGPNVLFVGLMGWHIGLNTGSTGAAAIGLTVSMVGILLPSGTLTFLATRWGHKNRELRAVRAFKQGMGPIVVGLLIATGWILATGGNYDINNWPLWLLAVVATLIVWRTKVHLLWLLAGGAVVGWFGLI